MQVRLLYARLMRAPLRSPAALGNLFISLFFPAVEADARGRAGDRPA